MARMEYRKLFLVAMAAALLAPAAPAAQPPTKKEMIGAGMEILGKTLQRQQGRKDEAENKEAAAQEGKDKDKPRTWGDRGSEMLDVVLNSEKPLSGIIKETADVVLDEYREQYKEEGRVYAREVGDILAERACSNPQISSTLTSIQALCWSVIGYLTLVTIYLVFTVHRLRRANRRLLSIVEKQIEKHAKQEQ